MAPPSESRKVGLWVLHERLGEGGNVVVWRGARNPSESLALKVLKEAGGEPYRRFSAEVSALQRIGDDEGVLAWIEAHLPVAPSKKNPAWLAMPIAQPIADGLAGESLDLVVEAVLTIAETLARLQRDHELAHRDMKPSNLCRRSGDWLSRRVVSLRRQAPGLKLSDSGGEAWCRPITGLLCAPVAPPVSENSGFQRTGADDGTPADLTR
jgi:hypothetical protein